MSGTETRPAIGTAEAAVQSCVRLIASVAGQPEALVAYWLDLYYQVRCVYERENAPEPDPQIITRADLYPVMRELMQDALKSAAGDEAKDRMERKRAKEEAKAELIAENEAMWQSYLQANGFKDPSTPLAEPGTSRASRASGCSDQDDRKAEKAGDGPPRASRAEIASHENPRVALAPTVADIPGPQTGVKGWAAKKAAIRDRLIAARDQGVTAAQLVTASEQKISDAEIYAILNAAKADVDTYRRLEAALEALGK